MIEKSFQPGFFSLQWFFLSFIGVLKARLSGTWSSLVEWKESWVGTVWSCRSLPAQTRIVCWFSVASTCAILSITGCTQAKGNTGVAACLPLQQTEFSKFLLPLLVSIVNSRLSGGDAELQLNDQLRCFGDFCFIDTRTNHSAVSKEKNSSSSFSFLLLSNPWEQSRGVEVSRMSYVSVQTALQQLEVQSLLNCFSYPLLISLLLHQGDLCGIGRVYYLLHTARIFWEPVGIAC